MDAARILREWRSRAALTQRALGERVGMSPPEVHRIEAGKVVPRVDTLSRLLLACDGELVAQSRLGARVKLERIRELLGMTPGERLARASWETRGFRVMHLLRVLVGRRVRMLLAGTTAERLHGSPLPVRALEFYAEDDYQNRERVGSLARGFARYRIPSGTLRWRWKPPGDAPYDALARAATVMKLVDRELKVVCLDDLIAIRLTLNSREDRRRAEVLGAVREETDRLRVLAPASRSSRRTR